MQKKVKKTREEEDADEKNDRQKMPNIDGVMPAVSGCHDGSARRIEHETDQ